MSHFFWLGGVQMRHEHTGTVWQSTFCLTNIAHSAHATPKGIRLCSLDRAIGYKAHELVLPAHLERPFY